LTQIYEGMFLLDNQVVREDWGKAKSIVTGTLEKHGAKVHCARRWDERKLAYPIKRRLRGTYCLAYFELAPDHHTNLRRDLDLSESLLRYMMLASDAVPDSERELARAEDVAGFAIPPPPPDDAPDVAPPPPAARRAEGDEVEVEVPDLEEVSTTSGTEA
jgi:small subunit ribosomal protein S6